MKVDTIIVGAGTAGLTALREVGRYTKDFLLVNDGRWGTTCAAVGCMPSKALIEVANAFHRRVAFDAFGIRGGEALRADIPAVLAHVRNLRDGFVAGPESVRGKLGRRAIAGRVRLKGPNLVEVNGEEIEARAIILAPGSRPVVPKDWAAFGDRILTSDTLFEQEDLPRRIAVIGMGAIGVEIAQALARLGVEVAGFDAVDGLAGINDPEILASFRPLLAREMALHLGAPAELAASEGGIAVSAAGGRFEADAVLAAIGRRPNIDGLGLESLGVALDGRGMPAIDPTTLRLGDLPVFLVGDANGYRPLMHEAADEGHIAGRNAAPGVGSAPHCRRPPLAIVFSSPQIARVGLALSEIPEARRATGEADFAKQPRARMAAAAAGLLRIHADRETAVILGAEMCIPAGEHMAHLLALAVERKLTVWDMLAMPFYHPTLEEGLRTALRDLSKAYPSKNGSDLATCGAIGHEALD
ncbi:dihydrolipoyl dehydrogenase [Rhodoblastus acidophilus]|uniref:Dihydrolipoyl dehydrogenase n=1 Tax=Candidatus Rhodoblastus alkanivorans TaxID=2954117 RepID=A0ABS9Z2F9_9HYPH|nr:dihydrolipoyl dehydrogenase [Candidatus Rhodoblastus alkanivorans]MCI4677477.1 dihydrolipoyl dehydrogenase [Candidatus Rhodoblastus alkanivorans]MCI4681836.1 dihydrolipoyl dehydrogenase [Candidatus Rhodoblastus alkanivorans]MDI4642886.1 dihydrolipoyl dehydrogenase [Rhodoblastus acidophilus]